MDPEELYNDDIHQRARDFEKRLDSGEGFYCDTDELEEIIEYYFENDQLNKAWKAITYGLSLFPYENYYQVKKAEVLLNKREIKQAIKILEEAKSKEPNNPEIAKLLGDCYNFSMQYKRAVDYYHIALKSYFEVDDVLLELIRIHLMLNKPEKAVSYLSTNPIDDIILGDTILPEIVKLFCDFNYTAMVIPFIQRLIDVEPYSFTSWYFLGYCYQKLEEYEKGMDAFEYCIAIDEFNSMGHLGKGNCLMELGRYEEAITYFNDSIDNDITDAEVYCNIAECFENLENFNSAKYYYLKALKIDKHLSDAYYGLGLIYKKQQRYKEAEKNLLKALDIDPFECLYHIEAAELYLLLDKKEQCFQHYDKAMEIDALTLEIVLDYSHAMVHFKETELAISLLKDAVSKKKADFRFYYRISSYLFQLGEYESAYNYLHQALELNADEYMLLYEFAPFTENNETVTNIIDLYLLK